MFNLSNTPHAALAALTAAATTHEWYVPALCIALSVALVALAVYAAVKAYKAAKTPIDPTPATASTPPAAPTTSALADTLADAVAEAAAKAGSKQASDYGVTTVTEVSLKLVAKAAALPKVQEALNAGKGDTDAQQAATPAAEKAVADIVDPAIKAVVDVSVTTATTAAVTDAGKKMTDAGITNHPSNLEAAIKAEAEKAAADALAKGLPKADLEAAIKAAAEAKANEIADKAISDAATAAKNAEFVKQQRLLVNKPAAEAKVAALTELKTGADFLGRQLVALGNTHSSHVEALSEKNGKLANLTAKLTDAKTTFDAAIKARYAAKKAADGDPENKKLKTALANAEKAEENAYAEVDRLETAIATLKGEIAALQGKVDSYPDAKKGMEQALSNNYAAQAELVKEIAELKEIDVDSVIAEYNINGEKVRPLIA